MSGLPARRARIADVRRVQHLQTALAASQAEARVATLESNNDRLARMRATLVPSAGHSFGAALAGVGELGMRLEKARDGLTDALVAAKATALEAVALRIAARQRQEGADKLHERAEAQVEAERERRIAALPVRRRSLREGSL